MFHSFMFLVLSTSQYGAMQAHEDSVYIYNTYTASVKTFEQTTQPDEWKEESGRVLKLTEAAIQRLSEYNKAKYESVEDINKEGVGFAQVFPKPSSLTASDFVKAVNNVSTTEPAKEIAFKVLDPITHFMTGANGKGKIPYVTMNYYAKGRILVKSEKLDPITLKPLETDGPVAENSSR
jgi:hypothetical protein